MRTEAKYYDVEPMLVRADRDCTIRIRPKHDHCRFAEDATYKVIHAPREQRSLQSQVEFRLDDGGMLVQLHAHGEQEHVLLVEKMVDDQTRRIAEFHIYSVRDDLIGLRPFKGDFHMHTSHSDGRESPAYVAARCREIGMDFIAITDHHRYAPSLEAIAVFKDLDIDLRLYPGEEVHPPGNNVHMVNFGGGASVNEMFGDREAHEKAVAPLVDELAAEIPAGVNAYHYASAVWSLRKIREVGGLAVFCHPYWVAGVTYHIEEPLTSALLASKHFDAFELIGGFDKHEAESNALQVARYHEEREKGNLFPVVGLSDSHGCERDKLFGWYYTVVFASSSEFDDLKGSIRANRSLAIEAMPGEQPRAHGPFRLAKYALFLMREYFPLHDRLCAEEGRAMMAHVEGDEEAACRLTALQGRTDRLWQRLCVN